MSFGDINRVNTNLQAMSSQFSLNKINSQLGDNQMKLSTGLRINRAEDDAAGFSIASKLSGKLAGLEQAERNVGDAKSMLDVAESGMNTIMDTLVDMKAKATQASTDSIGDQERGYIADQIESLAKEINTIAEGSSFQGTNLLGAVSVESTTAATTTGGDISSTFSTDLAATSFDLNGDTVALTNVDALDGSGTAFTIDDVATALQSDIDSALGAGNFTVGTDADALTLTADNPGTDIDITANTDTATLGLTSDASTDTTAASSTTYSTATSSLSFQVGDGSGDQQQVNLQDLTVGNLFSGIASSGNVSLASEGNGTLSLGTATSSTDFQSFIENVDSAIQTVSGAFNQTGIDQNSLSIKQENLSQSISSNSAARSRIQDADFAKVQSESVKLQIMQQTATSALAQANSSPQAVLGFLG